MGTKVHRDSLFPHTMRDLNEEFDSRNWPMCYRDNAITNGKYYNGFINKTTTDTYPDYERDALKQRMLEHEAVFKGQLYELHRLYRIQREMMEEAKKKELYRLEVSIEQPSSSSSSLRRLPSGGFPLLNSGYGQTSTSGVAIENSPSACREEYNARPVQFPFQNGSSSKECGDALSSRPSKVRKKLFDLQLPPEENTSFEEETVDLNQPIRIGVDTANEDIRQVNGLDRSSTRSVGGNGESILSDGLLTKSGAESTVNEKRVPRIYEAGYSKSTLHMQDKLTSASYKNSLLCSDQSRAQSNSWAHSVMSGSEKKAKFDSIATMDQSLLPSAQSQEVHLGGNWLVNASSGLNTTVDGLRLSSPLSRFSNLHCTRDNEPRRKVEKRTIDINLNEVVDEENMTGDNHSALLWLRHKGANASNDGEIETKKEAKTVKKILGIPIFVSVARTNEPAAVGLHTERNDINSEHKKRVIDINLECEPADDEADEEPNLDKENRSVRDLIDLNSCAIDGEDHLSLPSSESKTHRHVKRVLEIDLEAPPPLQESDDDTEENTALVNEVEQIHDEEALRNAAETIFAISSFRPQEAHAEESYRQLSEASSSSDPLLWFVDIVSSFAGDDDESPEIDEFEATTLQLQEMKEDGDYMPRPFVPEVQELDERGTNNSSVTRPRRGHYRRGRQRKDFQRDILPGLATLSRHEVTEDIQTFGGLMKATGHHWNSGLTRRNGKVRGRRRAVCETLSNIVVCTAHVVQKLGDIETVLEDRNLTGWGKTTRRPRRQRCHAGNNPLMAVLT